MGEQQMLGDVDAPRESGDLVGDSIELLTRHPRAVDHGRHPNQSNPDVKRDGGYRRQPVYVYE
jgi:hypothetical protein